MSNSLRVQFRGYSCQSEFVLVGEDTNFEQVQIKAEALGTGFDNRNDRIRD